MAFNIDSFKSSIGEFLRPFTYDVIVSPPTGGGEELRLRTETISLPGVSFAEVDSYKPYGNGLTLSIPHTTTVQEITCVHTVDVKGQTLQTFFDWANNIVSLKEDEKFSAKYYSEYARNDMTINVYDVYKKKVKVYTLYRVFPSSYDQVEMSWGSGSEIVRLNVTYKFEYFDLKTP